MTNERKLLTQEDMSRFIEEANDYIRLTHEEEQEDAFEELEDAKLIVTLLRLKLARQESKSSTWYFGLMDTVTHLVAEIRPDVKYSESLLVESFTDVATDIENGNVYWNATYAIHDDEELAERLVFADMSEEQTEVFESLYYWLDGDDRRKWLYAKYVAHDSFIYTDRHRMYYVEVLEG